MTRHYPEPAKTDFAEVTDKATRSLMQYLGNSTECHKLNAYSDTHIGYYSKRKAIQPAAINYALTNGFRVAACTTRTVTEYDGTPRKTVGYVEFVRDTDTDTDTKQEAEQ